MLPAQSGRTVSKNFKGSKTRIHKGETTHDTGIGVAIPAELPVLSGLFGDAEKCI